MGGIRPMHPDEIKLAIDEEVKLAALVASNLMANGIERTIAITEAFRVIDGCIIQQEQRKEERIKVEYKRRRGY